MIALLQSWPRSWAPVCAFALFFTSAPGLRAQTSYQEEKAWVEAAAAPPSSFSTSSLQAFEVTKNSALSYGIDPLSLTVGEDGVVRYVMVARSASGALNVMYQGIRCATAQTKTYARWSDSSSWNTSPDAAWQALDFRGPTRPAMMLARQGVCEGRTITGDARKILTALKSDRVEYR